MSELAVTEVSVCLVILKSVVVYVSVLQMALMDFWVLLSVPIVLQLYHTFIYVDASVS